MRSQRLLVPTVMYYHFFGLAGSQTKSSIATVSGREGIPNNDNDNKITPPCPLNQNGTLPPITYIYIYIYINKKKYLLGEFGESYYNISLEEFQQKSTQLWRISGKRLPVQERFLE